MITVLIIFPLAFCFLRCSSSAFLSMIMPIFEVQCASFSILNRDCLHLLVSYRSLAWLISEFFHIIVFWLPVCCIFCGAVRFPLYNLELFGEDH